MIQRFSSPIEMSQLEMLSLVQLLAAFGTFVRGTAGVRCGTTMSEREATILQACYFIPQ